LALLVILVLVVVLVVVLVLDLTCWRHWIEEIEDEGDRTLLPHLPADRGHTRVA